MPTYQYQEGGRIITRQVRAEDRDAWPGRMMSAPMLVCPRGEQSQRAQVMEGFRKVEAKIGTAATEREAGFRADHIKRIWEES